MSPADCVYAVLTVFGISVVSFFIIELPPGDFLTTIDQQARLARAPRSGADRRSARPYGLDQPIYVQYWKWISGIVLHGDFGQSFVYHRPVSELIADRLPLTIAARVRDARVHLDRRRPDRDLLGRRGSTRSATTP